MQIPEDHPAARELGEMILEALQQQPALHHRGAAAARVPAALQSLRGRAIVRHPRRQRDPARCPARRTAFAPISRRRSSSRSPTSTTAASCGRGHLRRAQRQAAGRLDGPLSVDQPSSRAPGDARRARVLVLLDPEHGARRRRAHAAVRSGFRHPAAQPVIPTHPVAVQLTGVYHNLLRKWAEV